MITSIIPTTYRILFIVASIFTNLAITTSIIPTIKAAIAPPNDTTKTILYSNNRHIFYKKKVCYVYLGWNGYIDESNKRDSTFME